MKKNRSTRLGAVIRLALVLGVISLLPTASHFAYAQLANSTTVTVPGIPSELINQFGRDTRLDTWNSQNLSTVKGSQIQVTTPAPSGGPGTPIIPKFANGINTPRIVSEGDNSAVQIADDAVVHGFLDVHEGILNTDTYKLCPACAPERQPVTFYSPVSIEPRPSIGTELSVRGEITASHILVSGSQGIDSGRIFVIARPGQTHTLQGNVLMNGGAVTIDSPFTIGQAGGVSIIKGPINLVGGDLNAAANISVAGTTTLTGNLAANANISVAGTSALKGVTNIGDPLVAPAVGSSMLTVWGGNTTLTQNAIIQGGLTVSGQSKNGGNGDVIIASNRVVIQGMNSNLVVNGTITSQNSDVKIGTPNVVGQPVTEKTLTVNGNINGKQIGRFYEVLGTLPVNIITNVAYAASSIVQYSAAVPFGCNTSDQIVSCEADWGAIPTAAPITAEWFAARSGNSCQVLARKKNAADANFVGPRARTMCFSPDG